MKASDKQKEANSSKNKSEDLHIDFKGKFSFIFKTLKVIYILSFTETVYIRDLEGKINQINKLFHNYEEQTLYNSLSELVLIKLNDPLKIQSPTNKYAMAVLVLFAKYLQNKIKFQKFFEDLLALIREVISFVKINGSKSNSIKIINEFGDYLNDYSQKLDSVKKASSLKNNEEEEKILSANDYDNMIKKLNNDLKVLKDELRKKEKDLEISNDKIEKANLSKATLKDELKKKEKEIEILNDKVVKANLDSGTYKDINNSLENKIKEIEKKFELKFGSMCNEITNLKKIIDVQNGKIDRLNNENSSQNNEIANLKDENVHLNNEIANLNDENVHLNNEIANLNDEIANLKELVNTQNSTIDSQENIIQMLREENSALYEMENQQREWIMALRDSYNQLDVDYNDLCNSVEGINNSLQEVIYNLQNYNPFNINFFE